MFPKIVYDVEHIDNKKIVGEAVGVTTLPMPRLTNSSYAGSIFYCRGKGDVKKMGKSLKKDITVGWKMGDIRNITSILCVYKLNASTT